MISCLNVVIYRGIIQIPPLVYIIAYSLLAAVSFIIIVNAKFMCVAETCIDI